jgi:hypothetical protein
MRLLVFPAGFETRLIAGAALLLSVLQIEVYPQSPGGLGFFASLIWTALYFANLVFPEHHTTFQYVSWPLMALADVTTVSGWHCLR